MQLVSKQFTALYCISFPPSPGIMACSLCKTTEWWYRPGLLSWCHGCAQPSLPERMTLEQLTSSAGVRQLALWRAGLGHGERSKASPVHADNHMRYCWMISDRENTKWRRYDSRTRKLKKWQITQSHPGYGWDAHDTILDLIRPSIPPKTGKYILCYMSFDCLIWLFWLQWQWIKPSTEQDPRTMKTVSDTHQRHSPKRPSAQPKTAWKKISVDPLHPVPTLQWHAFTLYHGSKIDPRFPVLCTLFPHSRKAKQSPGRKVLVLTVVKSSYWPQNDVYNSLWKGIG